MSETRTHSCTWEKASLVRLVKRSKQRKIVCSQRDIKGHMTEPPSGTSKSGRNHLEGAILSNTTCQPRSCRSMFTRLERAPLRCVRTDPDSSVCSRSRGWKQSRNITSFIKGNFHLWSQTEPENTLNGHVLEHPEPEPRTTAQPHKHSGPDHSRPASSPSRTNEDHQNHNTTSTQNAVNTHDQTRQNWIRPGQKPKPNRTLFQSGGHDPTRATKTTRKTTRPDNYWPVNSTLDQTRPRKRSNWQHQTITIIPDHPKLT